MKNNKWIKIGIVVCILISVFATNAAAAQRKHMSDDVEKYLTARKHMSDDLETYFTARKHMSDDVETYFTARKHMSDDVEK